MPSARNARQRTSKRKFLSEKTQKNKLAVVSTPQNVNLQPYGDSKLNNLIRVLDSSQTLLTKGMQFKGLYNENKYKEGKAKGELGQELDKKEQKIQAMVNGYETAKGKAESYDYAHAISEYFTENSHLDPNSFKEGLVEIQKTFLQDKTDVYKRAFVDTAIKADNNVLNQFIQVKQEETENKALENYSKSFLLELEETSQEAASLIAANDASSSETRRAFIAKNLRQKLAELQKDGESLNLSKTDISKRILQVVGRRAEVEGDPDLLSFAKEKINGISLEMTALAPELRKWEERAKTSQNLIIKQQLKAKETLKENARIEITHNMYAQLTELERVDTVLDPKALLTLRQHIVNYGNAGDNEAGIVLETEDYKTFLDTVDSLISNNGFKDKDSNVAVCQALNMRLLEIEDPGDVNKNLEFLNSNQHLFTRKDFLSYSKEITGALQKQEDEEYKKFQKQYNETRTTFLPKCRQMSDSIVEQSLNSLQVGAITKRDNARKNFAALLYSQMLNDKYEETKRKLKVEEIIKIQEKVEKRAFEQFPKIEVLSDGSYSNKGKDEKDLLKALDGL